MTRFRYLIDENTSRTLADQLHRLAPDMDVLLVGDNGAPPRGTLDPDILCWCERERFCLVTHNRKSMPPHLDAHIADGHHIQGIFTLRDKSLLKEMLVTLLLIWEAAEPDEYQDQIVYIPF